MSSSAERVQPAASQSQALLPEVRLGLRHAPNLEFASVSLAHPNEVLDILGEPSLSPRAVPKRRAEFAAGRHVAALALARFGCNEPVLREPSRAPRWPAGFVGSISHGAGVAVAVTARSHDYRGLGVDVEQWLSDEQCAEVMERVLSKAELALLAQAFPELSVARRVALGFSAKESLYKCLNPLAAEFIEFADARLSCVLPRTQASGELRLSLARSFSAGLAAGTEVPGCYALEPARVETLVWLPWRHS